ncbi:hypothetical protein BpHYR1_036647 [Brachionus plicatilis]|uniref:Uncharacterized protein n=1 Tax=Brachionus plicatilis TaxID=10195 RepID=A0A3M7SN83_BRAPC|nr:hypothetical protein BpHYR1_036647 [Brachionus plicatilis]
MFRFKCIACTWEANIEIINFFLFILIQKKNHRMDSGGLLDLSSVTYQPGESLKFKVLSIKQFSMFFSKTFKKKTKKKIKYR